MLPSSIFIHLFPHQAHQGTSSSSLFCFLIIIITTVYLYKKTTIFLLLITVQCNSFYLLSRLRSIAEERKKHTQKLLGEEGVQQCSQNNPRQKENGREKKSTKSNDANHNVPSPYPHVNCLYALSDKFKNRKQTAMKINTLPFALTRIRTFAIAVFYTAAIILLAQSAQAEKRVDIVLVGATGNLAKKYLWQSLFRLYKESLITPESPSFVVWPAASKSAKTASDVLEEILERNVECVLGVDYVVEEDIANLRGRPALLHQEGCQTVLSVTKELKHYKDLNAAISEDIAKRNRESV